MDNTVLDMFHGLYGPPDGNRKLQVSRLHVPPPWRGIFVVSVLYVCCC
jgi:hypothetical protein